MSLKPIMVHVMSLILDIICVTDFFPFFGYVCLFSQRKLTTVKVQVEDSNDNSPRFTQEEYVFRLDEEPGQDREVGLVSAADPDAGLAGTVTYTIKGVSGADIFNVDMVSGEL